MHFPREEPPVDAVDLSTARWAKSSRSGPNGQCVEYADLGDLVAVRDSKDPHGPTLTFNRDTWRSFVDQLKNG
jgi:hypothetical protein